MEKAPAPKTKQTWKPMKLTYLGDARDIVQGGGGKLSPPGGDPGEPRKQRPTG